MLRPGLGAGQGVHDVLQGLAALGHKVVAFELALAVPADHAGQKYRAATSHDAVGIAFSRSPAGRLQGLKHGVS